MSLWSTILLFPSISQECEVLYASLPVDYGIALEIREVFAHRIEGIFCEWNEIPNRNSPVDIQRIRQSLQELTAEIEAWVAKPDNIRHNFAPKIRAAIPILKELADNDPCGLFQRIYDLIWFELNLFPNPLELHSVLKELHSLKPNLSTLTEWYNSNFNWSDFHNEMSEVINGIQGIQTRVINLIAIWSVQQEELSIGIGPKNAVIIHMDQLKPTAKELYMFLHQIYYGLAQTLRFLACQLFRSTLVVTRQPSRVISQKNAKPEMEVCQLIGSMLYGSTEVKLSVLNEKQAEYLHQQGSTLSDLGLRGLEAGSKGRFVGDTKKKLKKKGYMNAGRLRSFEADDQTNQIIARYRPVELSEIIRGPKPQDGKTHYVVEEKFYFLFKTSVNIFGDGWHQIWTTSSPVTVSSHPSQNELGLAVLIWNYYAAQVSGVPFQVPEYLPWTSVASILSTLFRNVLELSPTDPGLDDDHLNFLKEKAFSQFQPSDKRFISFEMLIRKNIYLAVPEGSDSEPSKISFLDWFISAMKVLEVGPHKEMWIQGLFRGFIGRLVAESLFPSQPLGAFIIRFSDSCQSCISFVGVFINDTTGKQEVMSLNPLSLCNLTKVSLADRIKGLDRLDKICLWGSSDLKCKNEAFGSWYSKVEATVPKYHPLSVATSRPNNTG